MSDGDGGWGYGVHRAHMFRIPGQYSIFHSATEGKKLAILKSNNQVCVEFDLIQELAATQHPCKTTVKYRSVIGFGKASLVENLEEKQKALAVIFGHYSSEVPDFPRNSVDDTVVIKVELDRISGKQSI